VTARARRIVLCDRSASRARALSRLLELDPELYVVATFEAIETMSPRLGELAPDLIALELASVGSEGPVAIQRLVAAASLPVLVLGEERNGDGEQLAAALAAGAVEAIPADRLRLDDPEGVGATALRSRFKRLAGLHRRARPVPAAGPPPPHGSPGASCRVVGVGASVGGPQALETVLGGLPRDFALPLLIVQHVAPGFTEGLAKWLDENVAIPVALASDGAPLSPGAWLAPDGAHLRLEPTMRLALDRETERGAHRPSFDVLLESLAAAAGPEAVAVILTGMGRDGAAGVGAVGAAGGQAIAQDERTSAVFGMPAAAIEVGVDVILPLEGIAPRLALLRAREAKA
jgi:two-component system, chemotaxis family, protein-glutamate methylesterase/glutaminase